MSTYGLNCQLIQIKIISTTVYLNFLVDLDFESSVGCLGDFPVDSFMFFE